MDHIFIYRDEDIFELQNDDIIMDRIENNYSSYTFIIPEEYPETSYTYFIINEEHDKYIVV